MNEQNQGNEANKGVLPETIDHGKRKMEEEEEAPNSREQSLHRSCASTSEAGPPTYAGSSMIRTRIKEIPVDKVGYITGTRGQCIREIQSLSKASIQIIDLPPLGLAIIRGTQDQIEDAQQSIDDLLAQCPDHSGVHPDLLPDASSSTPASQSGMRPEPAAQYQPNPIAVRPPIGPAGSSSQLPLEAGLYAAHYQEPNLPAMNSALGPGSFFICPLEAGCYDIQTAALYQPNPLAMHPPPGPAGSSSQHPLEAGLYYIRTAALYQPNPLAMHPPLGPAGSSSQHPLEAGLYYIRTAAQYQQPNPPVMIPAHEPGSSFLLPLKAGFYHIQPAAQYQPNPPAMHPPPLPGSKSVISAVPEVGASSPHPENSSAMLATPIPYPSYHNYVRPPNNTIGNHPSDLNTQYQTSPWGKPPAPRLEIYYAPPPPPPLLYNHPFQSQAGLLPTPQLETYYAPPPLFDSNPIQSQAGLIPSPQLETYYAPPPSLDTNPTQYQAKDPEDSSAMHPQASESTENY
ncbi:hypothetical protein VitviT2T_004138 [Vitis vinifera]|uniref:K Homology domain-containing protein n=1 Tax=Vitis vinifera TaxID=29760 RepID=A0ABY9BNK8_VITVI|nr:hypothetical protein VitviT2T_004138 [Vitis vinifera]